MKLVWECSAIDCKKQPIEHMCETHFFQFRCKCESVGFDEEKQQWLCLDECKKRVVMVGDE